MIILDNRSYGSPEVPLAEGHNALQTLRLGGTNKPLGKRVGVSRRLHRLGAVRLKRFASRIRFIRCMGASSS